MARSAAIRAFLLVAVLLPWPAAHRAAAGATAPPSRTFTKPDGEVVPLPEGVEVLPDGTVLTNGVPGGRYVPPTAREIKATKMQRFAGQWVPFFLYVDDRTLLAPLALDPRAEVYRDRFITGLAAAPGAREFIRAVTGPENSVLLLDSTEGGEVKVLAEAEVAGDDMWFHEQMSLSPSRHWLLVTASPGRKDLMERLKHGPVAATDLAATVGDLWVIDGTKAVAPRKMAHDVRLLGCAWNASGALAALETEAAGGGPGVTIVDAAAGTVQQLPELAGRPFWSLTGQELRVYPDAAADGEVLWYHLSEHRLEHVVESWAREGTAERAWAADGLAYASVGRGAERVTLRLHGMPGHAPRLADTPAGVRRLLGWSGEHELLAYLATDGTVRFCSGAVATGGYERLMSAFPPTPAGVDPSAPIQSVRDGMALDTKGSPVKVQTPDAVLFTWATAPDGPCLIYTDVADGEQRLNVFRFNRMSLADLGIDLELDHKAQIAMSLAKENLESVMEALERYAHEHGDRLPPATAGSALEEALKPYLDYVGRMRSVHDPQRSAVGLLVPAGTTLDQLRQRVRSAPDGALRVAEFREGDGLVMTAKAKLGGDPSREDARLYYVVSAEPGQ
jgi:hypothetical protein